MSPAQNFILHPPAPTTFLPTQGQESTGDRPQQYQVTPNQPILLAHGVTTSIPILSSQPDEALHGGYGGYNVPRKVINAAQPVESQPKIMPHLSAAALGQLPVTPIPATPPSSKSKKMLKEPETY